MPADSSAIERDHPCLPLLNTKYRARLTGRLHELGTNGPNTVDRVASRVGSPAEETVNRTDALF